MSGISRCCAIFAERIFPAQSESASNMAGDRRRRLLLFPGGREIARQVIASARMAEKSVAYGLQNAPFVFTRQRVDVTDVLSALSYDGLPDVRAVCHFVSGRCRATDLK